MHTEILKIIEAGLSKDPGKVNSYATLLAENLTKHGEPADLRLAKRIRETLSSNQSTAKLATLDGLSVAPVDQESRMAIIDLVSPDGVNELVLPPQVEYKVQHFLDSIQHREKLIEHGLDPNTTVLLYGPPGCGKTSLANLLAHKIGLPLIVARFDSLISPLLGNTSKNIRKIFDYANGRPCVLFLDEFDAIAKARDDQFELGELKRVINSLLQNIDQFVKAGNILIAATNHPELLDRAIWRRFQTIIALEKPTPDFIGRLIRTFLEKVPNEILEHTKTLYSVEGLFKDLSPSDIRTICNNAISSMVMAGDKNLTYQKLVFEYFQFKEHGTWDIGQMIKFLQEQGLPQRSMMELTGKSKRQIQKYTKEN